MELRHLSLELYCLMGGNYCLNQNNYNSVLIIIRFTQLILSVVCQVIIISTDICNDAFLYCYEINNLFFLFWLLQLPESAFCAMLDIPNNFPLVELSCFCFFLCPMLIIIILYVRIGLRIRERSKHSLGKKVTGTVHHSKSRKSIIRMLCKYKIHFCYYPLCLSIINNGNCLHKINDKLCYLNIFFTFFW